MTPTDSVFYVYLYSCIIILCVILLASFILKRYLLVLDILARVIYKLRLNSWNTKYSQNVTCVCKNTLSVKHILLECPITTELFQKNGYDLNACNNVRDRFFIVLLEN